ncbi:MAG: hypothetical protein JWP81_3968 [Ferruginibacter sp.]|nr:hypothetical protein [Ferruginibacter sp.]
MFFLLFEIKKCDLQPKHPFNSNELMVNFFLLFLQYTFYSDASQSDGNFNCIIHYLYSGA